MNCDIARGYEEEESSYDSGDSYDGSSIQREAMFIAHMTEVQGQFKT